MRKMLVVAAALSLLVAGCGDSDAGGGGSIDDCDDLVAAGLDLIQDVLDEVGDMSMEELAALGDQEPEFVQDLETRGTELEQRQVELGCSDAELEAGLIDGLDSLEADGPVAELMLEGFKADPDFGS